MKTDHHILVAGGDAGLTNAVRAAAKILGRLRVETRPKAELTLLQAEAWDAAAVVAAIDPASAGALEDFHRLARSLPERKVIAAAHDASGEDVRRLFRAGAADVLTGPFSADQLAASLAELLRNQSAAAGGGGQGRIISVVRACGGAGATTLALNLAAHMAQGDGRRGRPPRSTAVLDLDLQFGDSDVVLDLQPRTGLLDVLRATGRVDARFLQTVMTEHESGLQLLAPAPSVVPLDAITPEMALSLLDHTAEAFERTFIDLPAAWSDWTFQVLARSDIVVLVAPPTVSGAVRVRRVLDALQDANAVRPIFFVLNKLNGVIDAFEKPSRIGKTLDMGVDASVSFDAAAQKAADRGKLVIDAFPNTKLAKDLRSAAAKLEGRLEALDAGLAVSEVAA